MQKSRVFIAIPVNDSIKISIRNELEKLNLDIKLIPEENYHLTVLFLGDVEDYKLGELINSLKITASSSIPFTLTTNSLIAKRNPHYHMLWVTFQNSFKFEKLASKTALSLNMSITRKPVPHINLTRSRKKIKGEFPIDIENIDLPVNSIELWKSILHPKGATYSLLASFKLGETLS